MNNVSIDNCREALVEESTILRCISELIADDCVHDLRLSSDARDGLSILLERTYENIWKVATMLDDFQGGANHE